MMPAEVGERPAVRSQLPRAGVAAPRRLAGTSTAPFRKAVGADLLPTTLSYAARFRLATAAGFEAIEIEAVADRDEAAEIRDAARAAGLIIHSVRTVDNCDYPLSSGDPAVVAKSVRSLHAAIEAARFWNAGTLLLIPAVVDARTSYDEAYTRSQSIIRNELLPAAAECGVVLGVENVWTGFLLSPLEYARYIDEFDSAWVRAYLDVGNMIFGYPEHWIRIAGHRIVALHLKDFHLDLHRRRFHFGKLGQGTVDWSAVRAALLEVGFSGYVTNTGQPGDRGLRWLGRAWRLAPTQPLPGISSIERALAVAQQRANAAFLADVARRFDRFRDGRLD